MVCTRAHQCIDMLYIIPIKTLYMFLYNPNQNMPIVYTGDLSGSQNYIISGLVTMLL